MEELHSSAAIDEEIKNDARKKAERILSKADADSKALLDGVAGRLAEAKKNATDASHLRVSTYEKNINASLPLEKQRYLVSYIHNAVVSQIDSYLGRLPESKRLEIIKNTAMKTKPVFAGKKIIAEVVNLNVTAAQSMLKEVFGGDVKSCVKAEPVIFADDAVEGIKTREGILLKAEDDSVFCRLTLDEKIRELLDTKMNEFATTLFCGRLPE